MRLQPSRPVISDQVIGRRQLYIENEQQPATVGRKQRIIVNGRTAHFLPPLSVTRPTPPRPRHFLTSWPVTEDTPSGGRQWQPDARLKMESVSLCTSFIEVPWFFTNALRVDYILSFKTCRSYVFCVFIVRSMIDKSMALTMRASFIEISCVRFGCAPPSPQPRQTAFILCQSRLLISSGLAPPCKPDPRHMQAGCRYKVQVSRAFHSLAQSLVSPKLSSYIPCPTQRSLFRTLAEL